MNRFRPSRTFVPALVALGLSGGPALSGAPAPDSASQAARRALEAAPGGESVASDSLYQLPVAFTTAAGRPLTLSQYRGEPVVVTMFYGTCKSACPLLTRAMTATADALPTSSRGKVRFLMVTLDPARDTTEELARFTKEYKLESPRFEVARTDENGVRLLAAALGVRYRQLPDGNFSHSSVLTALDADGVPKARTENIGGADDTFVNSLNGLVR